MVLLEGVATFCMHFQEGRGGSLLCGFAKPPIGLERRENGFAIMRHKRYIYLILFCQTVQLSIHEYPRLIVVLRLEFIHDLISVTSHRKLGVIPISATL